VGREHRFILLALLVDESSLLPESGSILVTMKGKNHEKPDA
jgi:hypothetical protein